jgi:hypothetical protein
MFGINRCLELVMVGDGIDVGDEDEERKNMNQNMDRN